MAGSGAAAPIRRMVASFVDVSRPGLMLLTIIVLFSISGGILWYAGINYDGLSGSAASKIHPSTYLAVLTFGWIVFTSSNPIGTLVAIANRRPASAFLVGTTLIFFAYVIVRRAPGMAGVLDTYLPPALLMMLLVLAREDTKRRIELCIHAIMAVNALLGLYEFLSGNILAPFRFDGEFSIYDTRSNALQGHPLINATVTAVYVMALLSRGGPSLKDATRVGMVVLQCAALVAFGGRSAAVTVTLLGSLVALTGANRALRRGRVTLPMAAAVSVGLTLLPFAIGALAKAGFFDALLVRFLTDNDSANARLQLFVIFEQLSWRDLLVGPDPELVDSVRRLNGLELGIEHPFLRTLLYQGLIITVLQTIAVVAFLFELGRVVGRRSWLPMLTFVILINTFESIGGKTTLLTKLWS